MIIFERTMVPFGGIEYAMHAMRNPMNSWDRNDTKIYRLEDDGAYTEDIEIGPNDKELSTKLMLAGPEHCKHLRFIMAYVDITAPLYWWKEFDTYRAGVEKISTSTMHKLNSRELRVEDFSIVDEEEKIYYMLDVLPRLNYKIKQSKEDKIAWEKLVHELPSSYMQKRSVMMSYAALKNICDQREGHKLKEWHDFIDWAHGLPYSELIFGEGEKK